MNNNINTYEKQINFIKKKSTYDEYEYNPQHQIYKFYQLCSFKNPKTKKYNLRITVFDERGNMIKTSEKNGSLNQCNKLIRSLESHQYKIYPTYDISIIDYPNPGDLLQAQSSLLTNCPTSENSYNGFAAF